MATPNVDSDPAAVHRTLMKLPRTFTMVDFLRQHTGGYVSDMRQSAGDSVNAANARAIAAELRRQRCKQLPRRASMRDDRGHRTTTSVWTRPR